MPDDEGPLYADRPTTEVSVNVDAPPEAVWPLVVDLDLPARFSTEFRGADWLDPPAVGARFLGRNAHEALGPWKTTSTVTELEPGRRFCYAVTDPAEPSALWRFTLDPLADGRTRLTQWMQIGPGRSGLSPAIEQIPAKERRIISRRLNEHRANMLRTCEGIKELAESASRRP